MSGKGARIELFFEEPRSIFYEGNGEIIMSDLQVQIVNLEPMRVICINGFGNSPETQAWEKMIAWAKTKGLWNDGKSRRFFGFNNPDPSPGSPNYGYDVWMTVDDSVQPDDEVRIINFPGGLYAVAHCPVTSPGDDIPNTWKMLVKWMEASRYKHASHQWLEEHIDPQNAAHGEKFTLDLFLPISE
jgi:DNA gyrase inhibitor GyrI